MLKIWLIRHGMTEGNRLKRYIGTTDEPLCQEGEAFLKKLTYPKQEAVYVSPLLRCRQSAEILFPGQRYHILDELSECDFGEFENKNYQELSGNANYQAWVDSNGTLPFPGGESREAFIRRSLRGFDLSVAGCLRQKAETAAVVAHGGTIMSVMEAYAQEGRSYYEWHVKNGGGYLVEIDPLRWKNGRRSFRILEAMMEG